MKDKKLIERLNMKKIFFLGIIFSTSLLFSNNITYSKETQVNKNDFIDQLALHDAVRADDLELVKFLIKEKSDLNAQDQYGYTPLHLAVRLNQFDTVKLLIDSGAKVNTNDSYEDTPLLDSTRNDYTNISELLICSGAHRDVSDTDDMSTLHNSSKNKNIFISKMLRAKDLTPYCKELGLTVTKFIIKHDKKHACGDVLFGVQTLGTMDTNNALGENIVTYTLNTNSKTWCSTIAPNLDNGLYSLTPKAKDIYGREASTAAKLSIDDDMTNLWIDDNFKIEMDNIDYTKTSSKQTICGDIRYGEAKTIDLIIANKNTKKEIGKFSAKIDNKNRRWCADITPTLNDGVYTAKANGVDYKKRVSVAYDDLYRVSNILSLNVKDLDIENKNKKVCGDIFEGENTQGTLSVQNSGIFSMDINNSKSWCSTISSNIKNGTYDLNANITDTKQREASTKAKLNIVDDITELWIDDSFKITLNDIDETLDKTPNICGDIQRGSVDTIKVFVKGKEKLTKYKTQILKKENRWCANIDKALDVGEYSVKAYAKSLNNLVSIAVDEKIIIKEAPKLTLGIDDHKVFSTPKPKLCGDILSGEFETIDLTLKDQQNNSFGPYRAEILKEQNRWCMDTPEQIPNGKYTAYAQGTNPKQFKANAQDDFMVDFNWGLYQALKEEFKDDFAKWDAELDKDSLTFRFKKPEVLFEVGKGDLRQNFQGILDDFFPRYLDVLKDYKDEIQEVRIEGHTSSKWGSARTEQERYDKNLRLSQKRADEVRSFVLEEEKSKLFDDSEWVDKTFKGYGMSFDDRIFYPDGTENFGASRRVEFEIIRKVPENI